MDRNKVYKYIRKDRKRVSKEDQTKVCKALGRYYGVDVKILKKFASFRPQNSTGYANKDRSGNWTIYILGCERNMIEIFFHELGHIHCSENRIWKAYHCTTNGYWEESYREKRFSQMIKGLITTAYKAECWVDRWAKKEMKTWFPKLKYHCTYIIGGKQAKEWLYKNYSIKFKKYLYV